MAESVARGDFSNHSLLSKTIRAIANWLSKLAVKFGFDQVAAELASISNYNARNLISSIFIKLSITTKQQIQTGRLQQTFSFGKSQASGDIKFSRSQSTKDAYE